MNIKILLITVVFLVCPMVALAEEIDSLKQKPFSGEIYSEVNYGHDNYSSNKSMWDFPHIVLSGELTLKKGWSITAELEYERFYEDGEWGNNFRDNFTTNKLFANKAWNESLNLKAGIIEVPVGITNSGGPALTIYDPESEASILPMTWHDGGTALWGTSNQLSYYLALHVSADLPLSKCRMLGASARLDYLFTGGLRIGASSFWGTAHDGQLHYNSPDYLLDARRLFVASFDADYQNNGWVIDASYIYAGEHSAQGVGIEAGFDFGSLQNSWEDLSIIPFARYDGVFNTFSPATNKWTAGLNFIPWKTLTLKAEYSWRHFSGAETQRNFNIGLGYTWSF